MVREPEWLLLPSGFSKPADPLAAPKRILASCRETSIEPEWQLGLKFDFLEQGPGRMVHFQ
jgi:hypothetical protein